MKNQSWTKITEDPATWPKHEEICWIRAKSGETPIHSVWEFINKRINGFDIDVTRFQLALNTDIFYGRLEISHWTPAIMPEFDDEEKYDIRYDLF